MFFTKIFSENYIKYRLEVERARDIDYLEQLKEARVICAYTELNGQIVSADVLIPINLQEQ
jgi:hypothetical protein